jgi:Lar family restriction alleviation protein
MKNNIKPCPFCGGNNQTVMPHTFKGKTEYLLFCQGNNAGCGVTMDGPGFKTPETVINAWNKRATTEKEQK